MAENALHKTVCTECGGHVEYPEESEGATALCPHCGKDLLLYNFVQPVAPEVAKAIPSPAIWNPLAAARWSLLFSPAFGAYIHAKNADILGRKIEAKENRIWFYVSLGFLAFTIISAFIPAFDGADSLFRWINLGILVGWYSNAGRKQVKFVRDTWAGNYLKRSWNKPLWVGLGCLVTFIALCVLGAIAIASQSPKPVETSSQPQAVAPESPQPEPRIAPPQVEMPNYDWNTTEIDAEKNGNITVAVNWLLRNPAIRNSVIAPQSQYVIKTPWNYFGKVVKLVGAVAVVQDFPSGSDFGQSLGGVDASDIVMVAADGTIVEMFCMKPSGGLIVGSEVIFYGYPVGNIDVENRVGGKDPHLILVGNDYDNLGMAR